MQTVNIEVVETLEVSVAPGIVRRGDRGLCIADTKISLFSIMNAIRAGRTEVYALDSTDKEKHPYTVTEQNFTIEPLQPKGNNQHGVFFTHPCETISYHYERTNPPDPRIGHEIVLETDLSGNVLTAVCRWVRLFWDDGQ